MIDDDSTASFLDKTDWRRTIHKALEDCVRAEGTEFYPRRVKSLISAFAADYPNFDARQMVYTQRFILEKKYSILWSRWLRINPGARRWQKYMVKKKLVNCLCHDMYEYIKNLCAKKRMLLWGTKSVPKGSQMGDE